MFRNLGLTGGYLWLMFRVVRWVQRKGGRSAELERVATSEMACQRALKDQRMTPAMEAVSKPFLIGM